METSKCTHPEQLTTLNAHGQPMCWQCATEGLMTRVSAQREFLAMVIPTLEAAHALNGAIIPILHALSSVLTDPAHTRQLVSLLEVCHLADGTQKIVLACAHTYEKLVAADQMGEGGSALH